MTKMVSKIAVDTNILVRIFVADDEIQLKSSIELLEGVDEFFVPTTVFVELVWVLVQGYKLSKPEVFDLLVDFIENSEKLTCNYQEVMMGLEMLKINGDFADRINVCFGEKSGYSIFATFDKKAYDKLTKLNHKILLLK